MKVSFTLKTKDIQAAFTKIFVLRKQSKTEILKISVYEDSVDISAKGISQTLKAKTEGIAEILVPAKIISAYLKTIETHLITFSFRAGELGCGASIFSSSSIEVAPTIIYKKVEIPLNLNRQSILRFAANKSDEEIKQLELFKSVQQARNIMNNKINNAVDLLKDYDVTFDEIRKLIDDKLGQS